MNQLYAPCDLARLGSELLIASGSPAEEAEAVIDHLVESSLMGHDSHGVMRIPEYLELVQQGRIIPAAAIHVRQTSATTAIIDCGSNYGQLGGQRAVTEAVERASQHKMASVVTENCNHVGRLGAYVQAAAEQGMLAIASCNSPIHGHFVLPWGGREGWLATNPLAYGIPTSESPIVADFATSVAPEGKIRYYHNSGQQLPSGWILDADGQPSSDPASFYGPPRGGILPFGGDVGYKGYALGLLAELLGSALVGNEVDNPDNAGNGMCLIVLDPEAFCGIDRFRELASSTSQYMKSSAPAPGHDEVLVPGELEFRSYKLRQQEGIPLDENSRKAIIQHAERLSVQADLLRQGESQP